MRENRKSDSQVRSGGVEKKNYTEVQMIFVCYEATMLPLLFQFGKNGYYSTFLLLTQLSHLSFISVSVDVWHPEVKLLLSTKQ